MFGMTFQDARPQRLTLSDAIAAQGATLKTDFSARTGLTFYVLRGADELLLRTHEPTAVVRWLEEVRAIRAARVSA